MKVRPPSKSFKSLLKTYSMIILGALLTAISIELFLYPNSLIDGGIVGISLIIGRYTKPDLIPLYFFFLNLPFIYLSYKHIRKSFIIPMGVAIVFFTIFLALLKNGPKFHGDPLEIIVLGGAILGIGVGLIIRFGGCLDGSEILGIIFNKRYGYTVGQVVLIFNIFVFAGYALISLDWHVGVKSLLTYIVAFKMIDLVIVGLDEIKSVSVISGKSEEIAKKVLKELGLGLTVTPGRGGFSGSNTDILNIIVERLDLAELKDLILDTDPKAFISITNVYEVLYGSTAYSKAKLRSKRSRRTAKK
ncbi:YitT family protein [bacterium]|nr:YitT family protein [bacterium]